MSYSVHRYCTKPPAPVWRKPKAWEKAFLGICFYLFFFFAFYACQQNQSTTIQPTKAYISKKITHAIHAGLESGRFFFYHKKTAD